MAKRAKGEVSFEHEGKTFTLCVDFNALAEFEDLAGVPNAIEALGQPLGAKMLRAMFCAALRAHHPEITLETAGEMLLPNVDKLQEALGAAFPQDAGGNEKPAAKAGR